MAKQERNLFYWIISHFMEGVVYIKDRKSDIRGLKNELKVIRMIIRVFLHSNILHFRSLLVSNSLNIYYIKKRIPTTISKDTTTDLWSIHREIRRTNEKFYFLLCLLPTTTSCHLVKSSVYDSPCFILI